MTTALTQPWAERLAWTLLHFIWQVTLLAAIYTLARLAAGSSTARTRYAMACAALLGMAVSPAATYWWLARSGIAASSIAFSARAASSKSSEPKRCERTAVGKRGSRHGRVVCIA